MSGQLQSKEIEDQHGKWILTVNHFFLLYFTIMFYQLWLSYFIYLRIFTPQVFFKYGYECWICLFSFNKGDKINLYLGINITETDQRNKINMSYCLLLVLVSKIKLDNLYSVDKKLGRPLRNF